MTDKIIFHKITMYVEPINEDFMDGVRQKLILTLNKLGINVPISYITPIWDDDD